MLDGNDASLRSSTIEDRPEALISHVGRGVFAYRYCAGACPLCVLVQPGACPLFVLVQRQTEMCSPAGSARLQHHLVGLLVFVLVD